MIKVRPMVNEDLSFGAGLSLLAGWNQTDADWRRFLLLQPGGCFVAELRGQLVGTVTTCVFDRVGWVGMVLVDPSTRRQGVGRALMNRAIQYLESQAIATIRLDATPMGMPLYDSLGFTAQYRLARFAGKVNCPSVEDNTESLYKLDWNQIADFDANLTGYKRHKLFDQFAAEDQINAFVKLDESKLLGYICTRPGKFAAYVGPCSAVDSATGKGLLLQAFSQYHRQEVFIDIPNDNQLATNIGKSIGLEPARELVRMCRGKTTSEPIESLWASGGPAKG